MQKIAKKDVSEEERKAKARRLSIKEGSAYSISDGFGLRNITPYALALGANTRHIGFLSSIPNLLGSLSQIYTIKAMEKESRKKIVFRGAFLQSIMWFVILLTGIIFYVFNVDSVMAPITLIILYTILIIFGSLVGPAWNSWMKDIVTERSGIYFGFRNRITGFVALMSMLAAGFILDYFKKTNLFIGFFILFFIAFLARAASAMMFKYKYEPKLRHDETYYFSFLQFIKAMHNNNFGRFVIYISLISLATAIASPFFAVYMLKELKFSYITYMVIIVSHLLVSLIFMPVWGKFSDRYGNLKTVKICGFFIPIIPFLWVLSPFIFNYHQFFLVPYLLIIEAFSGFAWSGFNLASGNFIYDAVTRQRMALCIAYFNIFNTFGSFIGATLGGFIASLDFTLIGLMPLLSIFLLSGIARLFITLFFFARIKEVRAVEDFGLKDAKKLLNMKPSELWEYLEIKQIKPPKDI